MALDLNDARDLATQALHAGARLRGPGHLEWWVSGNCRSPQYLDLFVRPPANAGKWLHWQPGRDHRVRLELHLRCRKCDACLRARSHEWRARIRYETTVAPRTWFGTLTLSPGSQFEALARARVRAALNGLDFDALDFGDQFRGRIREIGSEVTRWLKRVRKVAPGRLRTCIVYEQHASGLPHVHVLLHCTPFVLKRHVAGPDDAPRWRLGFQKWKLLAPGQDGSYVAKYLSKSSVARIRASRGYGKTPLGIGELREGGEGRASAASRAPRLSGRTASGASEAGAE